MEDDKYVVFKKEDWDTAYVAGDMRPLDDAVVIRRQDIFAAPAFFEYAGQIRTTIEIMKQEGCWFEQNHHLEDIADYFMQQGEEAMRSERKLPD